MSIHFELVSPEEKLVSEPMYMAVIPGTEGEMGVGAGHSSFVVALKPGVLKLYANQNDKPREIFISGGFADVTGTQCTVLAEEAINVADLDQKALLQELSELSATPATDVLEKTRLQEKTSLVQAKLFALTGERPH